MHRGVRQEGVLWRRPATDSSPGGAMKPDKPRCDYLAYVLPGLTTSGEERTSPITAQALPAWVIGSRFLGGFPSRMIARDAIAHAPSFRCVFARKDCALRTTLSSGFTPASARA